MLKRLNILAFIEKWDFLIISTTYEQKVSQLIKPKDKDRGQKRECVEK